MPKKMRDSLKAGITVVICNSFAAMLIILQSYLTVRYAPWGRWAADFAKMSSKDLAARYGDPAALLHKGLMLDLWVFGPAIALTVGIVAGLIYRRPDWRVSIPTTAVLIVIGSTPTSFPNIGASLLYIALSWLAMKVVCSLRRGASMNPRHVAPSPVLIP